MLPAMISAPTTIAAASIDHGGPGVPVDAYTTATPSPSSNVRGPSITTALSRSDAVVLVTV